MVKKDSSIQYVGLKKLSHKYIHIGIFHMKVNLIHTKSIFEIIYKNFLEQGNLKNGRFSSLFTSCICIGGNTWEWWEASKPSVFFRLVWYRPSAFLAEGSPPFDKDGPAHFISHPSPQTNQPLPVRKSLAVGVGGCVRVGG